MRSQTFFYEIQFPTTFILSFFSWDVYFWRQRFMCILAHILTHVMSTAMTSLCVAPCKSSPPVFLITLITNHSWITVKPHRVNNTTNMSNIHVVLKVRLHYPYFAILTLRGCYFKLKCYLWSMLRWSRSMRSMFRCVAVFYIITTMWTSYHRFVINFVFAILVCEEQFCNSGEVFSCAVIFILTNWVENQHDYAQLVLNWKEWYPN